MSKKEKNSLDKTESIVKNRITNLENKIKGADKTNKAFISYLESELQEERLKLFDMEK